MSAQYWFAFAAYLLPTFPLGYIWHLRTFKERYERLEISVGDFLRLETAFTVLHFAIVSPLIALAGNSGSGND